MTHDAYYKLPKEWQEVVAAIMQAGVKLRNIDCHMGAFKTTISVDNNVASKADSVLP